LAKYKLTAAAPATQHGQMNPSLASDSPKTCQIRLWHRDSCTKKPNNL